MYYGNSFADLATMRLEAKIKGVYAQAYREIEEKLNKFLARSAIHERELQAKVKAGEMTQEQFDRWKSGQVFIGKRWRDLRQNIAEEIYNSRKSATDMINGERKAVFQNNVNYAQYTIDKDYKFGVSFTIYDNATVTRLIKDDPDLLPDVKYPDPQIDYAWSKKQITSAITQGVLQGESIPNLAKRIGRKLESSNAASMVRVARTAMTGAQNSGRIQAMHNAQDMGIQVQKLWISTLDGRTRDSHRDLDGQLAEVDKPFNSILGEIMFPGDPNASPANTWNCRCTLGWEYPEYRNQYDTRAARDFDWEEGGQTEQIQYLTYREWEQWKSTGNLPQRLTKPVTREERLKQMLEAGNADIYETGKIFAEIMHDKISEFNKASDAEEAKQKLIELEFDSRNIGAETGYKELQRTLRGLGMPYNELINMLKTVDLGIDYDHVTEYELLDILREKYFTYLNERNALQRIIDNSKPTYYTSAEILKSTLSEFREMGSDGMDVKAHLNNSRSPMRKIVEDAYSFYPKDWVEKSIKKGNLTPKKVDRGYYSEYNKVIAISTYGGDNQAFETAVHELGHRFEQAVPEIRAEEKLFYDRRTAGENLEWLGPGYDRTEVTRKDNFINPYMGKDYHEQAYELVSMGFEYAYTNPERLAKDPDMESWIYGLLLTK